jgi:hypothetical protein
MMVLGSSHLLFNLAALHTCKVTVNMPSSVLPSAGTTGKIVIVTSTSYHDTTMPVPDRSD